MFSPINLKPLLDVKASLNCQEWKGDASVTHKHAGLSRLPADNALGQVALAGKNRKTLSAGLLVANVEQPFESTSVAPLLIEQFK